MDQAYDRWTAENDRRMSKQDFWDQLDAKERIAVFTGNLNQQVCNGGFEQWADNGYAEPEVVTFLLRLLRRMDTETSHAVADLITEFQLLREEYGQTDNGHYDEEMAEELAERTDPLDTVYYKINDQFLAEVDDELSGVSG